MLSKKKQSVERFLTPLIIHLSQVNPNFLTLLGSIPPLLFFVALITHHYLLALIAFAGNIIDLIDGMVARKYHKVTIFGGFLDSTLDRVSDFFIISAFAFSGLVRWEIVAPLLLVSFLTSYIRSRGELAKKEVSFAVGLVERTERLVGIFFTLLIYVLFPDVNFYDLTIAEWGLLILLIVSFYTVLQRIGYAYKKL